MENIVKNYVLPAGVLVPTVLVETAGSFSWDRVRAEATTASPSNLPIPTQTLNGSYRV
jgi:hypothetical protein